MNFISMQILSGGTFLSCSKDVARTNLRAGPLWVVVVIEGGHGVTVFFICIYASYMRIGIYIYIYGERENKYTIVNHGGLNIICP